MNILRLEAICQACFCTQSVTRCSPILLCLPLFEKDMP
jgi:hypothetical protein